MKRKFPGSKALKNPFISITLHKPKYIEDNFVLHKRNLITFILFLTSGSTSPSTTEA